MQRRTRDLGQGGGDHCLLSGDILIPTQARRQPERDPTRREGHEVWTALSPLSTSHPLSPNFSLSSIKIRVSKP
jgi:hypothetical protein